MKINLPHSLRGIKLAALSCVLLVAAAATPFAAADKEKEGVSHDGLRGEQPHEQNPHEPGDMTACGLCHTSAPPKLSFDPVTTCVKCHSGNVNSHPISRHPVGKAPRINLPSAFPLAQNGQMVCYTCHDQHNASGHKRMLRVEYDRLCVACHAGY